MGNVNDWMEDEMCDFAGDKGVEFDDVILPWKGKATFARKDLVAILRDEDNRAVGKVHFGIIVSPDYGKNI